MVNLPLKEDQDRSVERLSRSHHQWGIRYGVRRRDPRLREEPTTLHQLEALATRAVELMEKHGPPCEGNFEIAMDLLRLQYNLNFKMVCGSEECSGSDSHCQDELLAPER
ncbi:hypothetical protein NE865_11559 [Phthorimaea operculella]|nr:hypothetical protein NE865_11559 [Phthorimaea operculella]